MKAELAACRKNPKHQNQPSVNGSRTSVTDTIVKITCIGILNLSYQTEVLTFSFLFRWYKYFLSDVFLKAKSAMDGGLEFVNKDLTTVRTDQYQFVINGTNALKHL